MELSLKEAAAALGISLTTARRWIKTGRLRAAVREGPYGPEYIVTPEELERARQENPAPITVILPDPKDQQGVTVPREWLAQAMRGALEEALASTLAQMTRGMEDTLATSASHPLPPGRVCVEPETASVGLHKVSQPTVLSTGDGRKRPTRCRIRAQMLKGVVLGDQV